jgi:hypothetical protein
MPSIFTTLQATHGGKVFFLMDGKGKIPIVSFFGRMQVKQHGKAGEKTVSYIFNLHGQ